MFEANIRLVRVVFSVLVSALCDCLSSTCVVCFLVRMSDGPFIILTVVVTVVCVLGCRGVAVP